MDPFDCINSHCGTGSDCGCAAKLRAEIKRLTALNEGNGARAQSYFEEIQRLQELRGLNADLTTVLEKRNAEIERLTADANALAQGWNKASADNERLRAVITRAKDALLDGQSTQWVHDLLAAALAGKSQEPSP